MQTAMGSSISMTVFNCRDQGSTTTKDHKISTVKCKNQGSTTNIESDDQHL